MRYSTWLEMKITSQNVYADYFDVNRGNMPTMRTTDIRKKRKILKARFSASVQTGTGAHPASYTVGTG
jgi:hypothetical protein